MKKQSKKKQKREFVRKVNSFPHLLLKSYDQKATEAKQEKKFLKQVQETRALLKKYKRFDAAVAVSISELWPANTGSPVKHIFAWCVLLGIERDSPESLQISSYRDFKFFLEKLYLICPEFPTIEDFSSEADWGQVKVRLGQNFVPIFYGSCIERTSDFIEAFRITYAHLPEAQAHMDIAIYIQSKIIRSIPEAGSSAPLEAQQTYIEIPPKNFWIPCKRILNQVGNDIKHRRNEIGQELHTYWGVFKATLNRNAFTEAIMEGKALPFLTAECDGNTIPISIRNAPNLVIDHGGNKNLDRADVQTHRKLAQFVAERFRNTIMPPLTLLVDQIPCEHLPMSCAITTSSDVYLICACDHPSINARLEESENIYTKVKGGSSIDFADTSGHRLTLFKEEKALNADNLHIIIVVTQSITTPTHLSLPRSLTRFFPLADFITIFDSLNDISEIKNYWNFVDTNIDKLHPLSFSPADLFASFKDTNGILIEGALSPNLIALDPHWGTSWRFESLTKFWSNAPPIFPGYSSGWRIFPVSTGIVRLESRHELANVYSTSIGTCTVQAGMKFFKYMRSEEVRLLDLFVNLLINCSHRCGEIISEISFFRQPHILLSCSPDPSRPIEIENVFQYSKEADHIVSSVEMHPHFVGQFHIRVNTRAVLQGLSKAKDASFEVCCLLEILKKCHIACDLELPKVLEKRILDKSSEPAHYSLELTYRKIDVPDYVDPIVPLPSDYKLARRHLAEELMKLGLSPGRYEFSDAKSKISLAASRLRFHIESRLASLDRHQLLQSFIEQHDALLVAERIKIHRTRQSLSHFVEYDRLESINNAIENFGNTAKNYLYLLEKLVSSPTNGKEDVTEEILRELVALADWHLRLNQLSDIIHNSIAAGGLEIDNTYCPKIFYSQESENLNINFSHERAKSILEIGINSEDTVEGMTEGEPFWEKLRSAFRLDLGFDLKNMIAALAILSESQRRGLGKELSLSYSAAPNYISEKLADIIYNLDISESKKIVDFLTLSEKGILKLAGRDGEAADVPYWEHWKRTHRYAIRPLIIDGSDLRWGAETASRAMRIWSSTVLDGYLPANFDWPHVTPVVREIKESIEKRLELRSAEIFKRYTQFVFSGIDFFRKFKIYDFEDVGDFDVFAYWPRHNLLVTVECKYNQPSYTMKDGRRLRDRIFGKTEHDRDGQFSRIFRRNQFLENNRPKLLELLNWPESDIAPRNVNLYVCRDLHYWMIHPPYPISTQFVPIDALSAWIKTELLEKSNYVT